jgi:YD repeat-containing protein
VSFRYSNSNASGARQSDYAKGFVKRVTELDGSQVTYGYDDLDRLTSATRSGTAAFSHTYAYDLNNNRTGFTSGGTTTSATYDNANQITSLGGTSYSYDRNGNLTAYGSNSLSYDQSNKWTSGTVNGQSVQFGYDGHGRRTFRTVAGSRTDHWYDWSGLTLETGANSVTYLRDPDGLLLSKKTGGLYNYGRDRLGSITALTASAPMLKTRGITEPLKELNH